MGFPGIKLNIDKNFHSLSVKLKNKKIHPKESALFRQTSFKTSCFFSLFISFCLFLALLILGVLPKIAFACPDLNGEGCFGRSNESLAGSFFLGNEVLSLNLRLEKGQLQELRLIDGINGKSIATGAKLEDGFGAFRLTLFQPGSGQKIDLGANDFKFFSFEASNPSPAPATNSPGWGLLPIIYSKLGALFLNLLIIGRGTLFFMAPLFLFGFFFRDKLRETPEREVKHLEGSGWKALEGLQPGLLPFTLYLVLLYLVMSFFFTFPSTRGSVFHSSGGLLPYLYLVSLAGLDKFIGWVGTFSRPGAFKARQNFYRTVLIGASILVSVGFTLNLASSWNEDFDNISQAKTWLKANVPANALVMVPDAPAFYFVTGRSAIVISTDSLKQNLDIARRYGASYMVLQTKYLTGPLYDLFYKGGIQGFELVARLNETKIYRLSPGNPTP